MANQAAQNCIDNGTISVDVPNLSALDDADGKPKPITSTVVKIGGLSWRTEVHKVKVDEEAGMAMLDLHVYCNEDVKDRLWLCKVDFHVQNTMNAYSPNHHGFNGHCWILPIFGTSSDPLVPIKINLDVVIRRVQSDCFPALDTNLVVNMGGNSETLPVNKYAMASLSSYFRNLFFEDWNDKKEHAGKQFELNEEEDFDLRAFKAMIYAGMTMGGMVHEANFLDYELAVGIVKMAIKFDVSMLLDCCVQFLLIFNHYSMMNSLELADQFNLVSLKEHCLDRMSVLDFMEDFGKSAEIHSRLSKATQKQLKKKLGGKVKELRESTVDLGAALDEGGSSGYWPTHYYNKLAKAVLGMNAETIAE